MPLVPFEEFVIDSPLAPERAAAELGRHVVPRRRFGFGRGAAWFEGEVTTSDFQIRRMIGYQNAFLPQIQGSFERSMGGTRVSGTMRVRPFVVVFVGVWMVGVLLIPLATVVLQPDLHPPSPFITAAMAAAVWALGSWAFAREARLARRRLTEILDRPEPR
ncbi:MAG TPA: hypothetical protein VF613_18510 [Longimicrobium sp.]